MSLSKRISSVRQEHNLSQQEFAERFGVSLSALKSYEKAVTEPTPSMLIGMIEAFGLNPNWLLTGDGRKLSKDESDRARMAFELVEKLIENANEPIPIERKVNLFNLVYEFTEKNEINDIDLMSKIFMAATKG